MCAECHVAHGKQNCQEQANEPVVARNVYERLQITNYRWYVLVRYFTDSDMLTDYRNRVIDCERGNPFTGMQATYLQ